MELKKKTILSCEGLFEPLSVDAEGNLLGGFGLINASTYTNRNTYCIGGSNESCYNHECDGTTNKSCSNRTCTKNKNEGSSDANNQYGGADLTTTPPKTP